MSTSDSRPLIGSKAHVHIRPIDIDDLAAVFHLGEKIFTRRNAPNAYRTWDEYEVVDYFQSESELCFVAEQEDRIVGFVLGSVIEKNDSAWTYGYLTWLGVDPILKGHGVGKRLVKEFVAASQKVGARMLIVDTDADNTDALAFFARMGFNNREEHVYMSLNLTTAAKRNGKAKVGKPPRSSAVKAESGEKRTLAKVAIAPARSRGGRNSK